MSMRSALTEYITTEKFFTWRINNFDAITLKNLEAVEYTENFQTMVSNELQEFKSEYYLLKSPTMIATHPSTGVKCNRTIVLKFESDTHFPRYANILLESDSVYERTYFSYKINDGGEECKDIFEIPDTSDFDEDSNEELENPVIKTVTIFANVVTKRCETFELTPFKATSNVGIVNRLKNMWENDSTMQFMIKCGIIEIKVSFKEK